MNQLKRLKRQIPKYHKSVLLRGSSFVTQEFSIMSQRSINFHKFVYLKMQKKKYNGCKSCDVDMNHKCIAQKLIFHNATDLLEFSIMSYLSITSHLLSSSDFAYRISQVLYFITSCIPGTRTHDFNVANAMPYCLSQSYLSQMFFSKLLRGKKAPLTHVRVQMNKCIYHIAQIIWLFSTRDVRLLPSFLSFEKQNVLHLI